MTEKSVEIFKNIFSISSTEQTGEFTPNIYLINEENESVLFGTGPVSGFNILLSNILKITEIDRLKYIILQDYDPALCSALPLFERNGFVGRIITHWNSSCYIKKYGVKSEFIYSNLSANRLCLNSGRLLRFISTPYLKSAGSFAVHDPESGILFSGDLFGAFAKKWSLYAGDDYSEDMKKYHSEYMPSSSFLRLALGAIMKNDISMIAPLHGSIINQDIDRAVSSLMGVQCGSLFRILKFDIKDNEITMSILNDLLEQYKLQFTTGEILDVFKESGIVLNDETCLLSSYDPDITDLWNHFFEIIFSRKGLHWIDPVEKDLLRIAGEYRIDLPEVYSSSRLQLREKYEKLENEKTVLLENLRALEIESAGRTVKDPLAQVYKEDMFRENLISDIIALRDLDINFAFFIIEIDNLIALNTRFGREAGDELLANTAYLLKNFKKTSKNYAHHLIFRMNGPRFTYYCNDVTKDEIIAIAEGVRTEFRESKFFITDITVSIGVAHSDEISAANNDPENLAENILELANTRLRLAKHSGADSVCSDSKTAASYDNEDYIMVIDPDISVRYLLETHLRGAGFNVETCTMGDEALEKIDVNKPAAIISGLMLPKMDGFSLRKKMLEDSDLKNIPFILTSSVKDDKSIIRAQSLGIYHYLKKPFSIVELVGLIKILSKVEM